MTELIKQRLVGMLIVVIAGVVFLPDLLDGKKQLTKEEFKKVPVRPETDEQPIISEFPRVEVEEVLASAPQTQDFVADDVVEDSETASADNQSNNTEAVTEAPVVTDSETVQVSTLQKENAVEEVQTAFASQAWILQLGSFKHKENVDALRQKLKEAGFDTFTKPVKTKAGLLSKVYIGPELEKESLQSAQAKLKEIAGIEGKITRFDPTK